MVSLLPHAAFLPDHDEGQGRGDYSTSHEKETIAVIAPLGWEKLKEREWK